MDIDGIMKLSLISGLRSRSLRKGVVPAKGRFDMKLVRENSVVSEAQTALKHYCAPLILSFRNILANNFFIYSKYDCCHFIREYMLLLLGITKDLV
jgi:hypothetical protein